MNKINGLDNTNRGDMQLRRLTNFILLLLLSGFLASRAQALDCGGLNQRACCAGERNISLPSCNAGLWEAALGQYPNACPILGVPLGAGTCLPKTSSTPCGREGQRACCALSPDRIAGCDSGLEEQTDALPLDIFEAVSGDASCSGIPIEGSFTRRSRGTCIRHDPLAPPTSNIPEPGTGWTAASEPRGVLRGYHDMHLHLVGHMAHGGKVLSGEPAPVDASGSFVLNGTYNINTALSPAKDLALHKSISHGLLNDTPGDGTQDGTRSWYGAPYFSGWPKWTSTTHQQAYYVWLERAWRGGLRTTTMLAVHNESLCKTSLKATRDASWPICGDSMRYIVEQLNAAKDFQQFIDDQSGGEGRGWFRIVTTPQQAREVVRAGKLAVVLGIEVDSLFNCKEQGCPADFGLPKARIGALTQPTTIEEAVAVIYDMGVRHVFPVHNFDNGFGAAATWMDAIAVGQAVSVKRWWETRDCGDGKGDYGFWLDNALFPGMLLLGFGVDEAPAVPDYISGSSNPGYASCNARGLRLTSDSELKPGGQRLIQALMNKGMLIDVDHMSNISVDNALALTRTAPGSVSEPYPLLASHVQFFDLHQKKFRDNRGRHERMRTRAQLDAIRSGGGMIAAMLKDDVQDTDLKGEKYTLGYTPAIGGAITDNCRHSSKTWGQALQYGIDVMGGPVSMGSDFNGAAGHVGPRFGSEACGGWGEPNGDERLQQELAQNKVVYPFNLPGFGTFNNQVTGFKTFDYNVDGLAHVGLLPDMVADLQNIGLDQHYTDQLFCSAEAYIRVWERAEALAGGRPAPDPARPWLCNVIDVTPPTSTVTLTPPTPASGWHQGDVIAAIIATDADSGVEMIDYQTISGNQILGGSAIGEQVAVTINNEGLSVLSYFATDKAGNVEQQHSVSVSIDRTAPEITAVRAPSANPVGWNNTDVVAEFTCRDALSGIARCTGTLTLTTEGSGQSITGTAYDKAGNSSSAIVSPVNIDKTPPVATVTGVINGQTYIRGAVPAAACTTVDQPGLSGVATPATLSITGGNARGVGTFIATCSGAGDVAGNVSTPAKVIYYVHYDFSGFFPPVDNQPILNAANAGSNIPVKFSLSGNFGTDIFRSGGPGTASIPCSTLAFSDILGEALTSTTSGLSYDASSDQYNYRWKSDKAFAGTCRRFNLNLDDGSEHFFYIKFK